MAIKRVTFEIDDTNDLRSRTGSSFEETSVEKHYIKNQTKSVEDYKDAEVSKTDEIATNKPTVGRTISDLVVEFKNDARVMSTILIIISFILFINKFDSISSFQYPLILSVVLNLAWYIIPAIENKIKKKTNT